MVSCDDSNISCGVMELSGLYGDPERTIEEALKYATMPSYERKIDYAFILFSDNIKNKNGEKLAACIRKHKLGLVMQSKVRTNPVHNSDICVWIWHLNKKCQEIADGKQLPRAGERVAPKASNPLRRAR